jgi:hypothetical protein
MSTRVEIPEEDILRLQKLEMARIMFEKRLRANIEDDEETTFSIISNDAAELSIDSGLGYPIVLAEAEWDLLGLYHPAPGTSDADTWMWTWAWTLISPPEKSRAETIRNVVKKSLPEFTVHESILLPDSMLISYIQARLLDLMKYQYIHIQNNGNGAFTAFGLRNVSWKPYDAEAHKNQLYYTTLSGVRT